MGVERAETTSDPEIAGLDAAVAAAVADGLGVVDRLAGDVTAALRRCVDAAGKAASGHEGLPGAELIDDYRSMLGESLSEADHRFERQRERLATFNLVLFGRTGAGKSSLIEALSNGDGMPISPGDSDWTTEVRDVRWHSSRLVDTPGIEGWGGRADRSTLEARAEAAVADADIVIICFDTQSQQEGEFSKIAEWVGRYGKPVVAVLNSRNQRWRVPIEVEHQASRRALSQTVHEHAGNIRDELAQIGLTDVPIVAIHSQRASFARTVDPYRGPNAIGREKQRAEIGPDRLLAWSNLPALELLLSSAVEQHAARLRLGMLHDQARGLLATAQVEVTEAGEQAQVLAEQVERGIVDVVKLVGRPDDKQLAKRIRRLEKLRGGLGTVGAGELRAHAGFRLSAGLQEARRKAILSADHAIDVAFEEGEDLDAEAFDREVLAPARAESEEVASRIGSELRDHLARRLALVADDVQADLNASIGAFEGADVGAGRSAKNWGTALQTGSGLVTITGSVGAALVSGPPGWIVATVIGTSIVAGVVLSHVGRKLRERGAGQRLRARSEARARGRRAVHDAFDDVERAIGDDISRTLSQAAHEKLTDDVAKATALRLVVRAAGSAASTLQSAVDDVPTVLDASGLLADVANELQRQHFPGDPTAGRLLWLGESWCDDPEGMAEVDPEADADRVDRGDRAGQAPDGNGVDPAVHEQLLARIRSVVEPVGRTPLPGAGVDWVADTVDRFADDTVVLDALAPIRGLEEGTPPRVVLAGDYSTGKSSFVKRLLVDAGQVVPEGLEVAAQPKTEAAATFAWGGVEIVDTPGFQSNRPGHAAAAREAVVGASLVVVLFNPNLVVGASDDLVAILFGDRSRGRVGKSKRTLFVINRADELGIDPEEDLAGFQNLCRRKELELAQALGSLPADARFGRDAVVADQILCVASDPYGLVGDRIDVSSVDYDRHRGWDGVDALRLGVAGASSAMIANGLDIQVLEGGAAILGDLVAARRGRLADLEATIGQRRLLLLDLDACLAAGRALQASARDRLANDFASFVASLFDDVGDAEADQAERTARVERLEAWASDPGAEQLHREWTAWFGREQERWQEATSDRVEARLISASFTAAFPGTDSTVDVDHLKPPKDGAATKGALKGANLLAGAAKGVPKEKVIAVAHKLGHKFRPWGATKLTSKINVAGGALGVAFGAIEIYGVYRSVQDEKGRERTDAELRSIVLRQVRDDTEGYFDAEGEDAPGRSMADAIAIVQHVRDEEDEHLREAEAEAASLVDQIDRCERQVQDALERLERSEP